jgi:8-oxo-dGTP pyrophosphatase MutT (NUDIX family)
VYLINRNAPPQGLALPGGFFDMQDGIDPTSPPDPASIGANAAARELKEETGADISPSQLSPVGRFSTGKSDTREKNFFVWAYFYQVPDQDLRSFRFGDDASQATGSPELAQQGLKGWYKAGDLPRLAFPHHLQILAAAAAKMSPQQ